MMRPPGPPDILDSSRGGPSEYSVSFVSDPFEVSLSRASSIKVRTSGETMGMISLRRLSYRAKRRLVAVRSSAVLRFLQPFP